MDAEGRFIYWQHVDGRRSRGREYNLLRHAGTLYAMAGYEALFPSTTNRAALARGWRWLRRYAIGPVDGRTNQLAVWTTPEQTGDPERRAKLGGAALALLAGVRIDAVHPGVVKREDLRALAEFIVSMQERDGRFYAIYYPGKGPDPEWTSLYYPGEAIMALTALFELDRDPRWLEAAALGLEYRAFQGRRQELPDLPADHWTLLAMAEFWPQARHLQPGPDLDALEDHAARLCERILLDQLSESVHPRLAGAFDRDGRTAPTATRIEGLLAAGSFLSAARVDLRERIQRACENGVRFLLTTQLREGPLAGGFPAATVKENGRHDASTGELRIDYTQHAMSAFMGYLRLFHGIGRAPIP